MKVDEVVSTSKQSTCFCLKDLRLSLRASDRNLLVSKFPLVRYLMRTDGNILSMLYYPEVKPVSITKRQPKS